MNKINYSQCIGQKFNRWTVLAIDELPKRLICRCDCGTQGSKDAYTIVSGLSKSCGCYRAEKAGEIHTKHGQAYSKEYNSWRGMKERCTNPKNSHYPLYGARGISYTPEWESFDNFLQDMGSCPEDFQLDRIDVNQGYSKENCRWVDKTIQAYNIRRKSNNKTGRTGVYLRENGRYDVRITVYKRRICLGTFLTFEEACKARDKAELEYYGVIKE